MQGPPEVPPYSQSVVHDLSMWGRVSPTRGWRRRDKLSTCSHRTQLSEAQRSYPLLHIRCAKRQAPSA